MMLSVVAAYGICWFPLNLYNVLFYADPASYMCLTFIHYIYTACHWIAMCHSCMNPAIYFYMNLRYRAALYDLFGCISFCHRRGEALRMVQRNEMSFSRTGSVRRRLGSLGGAGAEDGRSNFEHRRVRFQTIH